MEPYGILLLTGEACAYSSRGLCDLTEKGAELIRNYLSLPCNCPLNPPWNTQGVASILLPWDCFSSLVAFCCLTSGECVEVIRTDSLLVGVEPSDSDKHVKLWLDGRKVIRTYQPLHGSEGGRNRHQMSGRLS